MRDVAEAVAGWIIALREVSPSQWVLRWAMLLSGVCAVLVFWLGDSGFFFGPVLGGLVLIGVAVSIVIPGSGAPLFTCAVVFVWWLMAGGTLLRVGLLALCLAVFHLAAAWAAAGPRHAKVTPPLAQAMARAAFSYLVVVGVLVGLVIALTVAMPRTPGGLWIIGLAAIAAIAWTLWSRRES